MIVDALYCAVEISHRFPSNTDIQTCGQRIVSVKGRILVSTCAHTHFGTSKQFRLHEIYQLF